MIHTFSGAMKNIEELNLLNLLNVLQAAAPAEGSKASPWS
jgi:hypothetical protein